MEDLESIPDETTDFRQLPKWLQYGEVCKHDDGFLCGHRAKHLIKLLLRDK